MKYFCCLCLCIFWLICHAQLGIFALHVQQAPEIIQRITRQATRYASGGSIGGGQTNYEYQPSSSSFNLRNAASDLTSNSKASSQLNSVSSNSGQRPVGVGAYSFGGMASGRPTNGNSFVVGNSVKGSGLRSGTQSVPGQTIIGSGSVAGNTIGRPQHLQQALLKAAQYQLQQQQQYQQLQQKQQQPQQYQQQHQQLRRQLPSQQLYRQRPAATYQQYN